MLPINCDVVGILIKRHASPFVNDTSNYQKKTDMYFFMDPLMFFLRINKYLYNFFCYILYNPKSKTIPSEKWNFFFAPLKKIVVEPIGASIYLFGL